MKRLCLLLLIFISACKSKTSFSKDEIDLAKQEVKSENDHKEVLEMHEYLTWEAEMKKLYLRLNYSSKEGQRRIDSTYLSTFSKKNLPPAWYSVLRKQRDTSFQLPDSLLYK